MTSMNILLFAMLLTVVIAVSGHGLLDQKWESWKQEHRKTYEGNSTEEFRRFSVWKSNVAFVEEHNRNAKVHGYTLKINKFGDLTTEEFVAKFNGYRMSDSPKSSSVYAVFEPRELPTTVDWRLKGAVSEVKDQGSCGSCWAFSTTGALESHHFLKYGQLVLLSEQNLMDCTRSYGNKGCDGGRQERAFQYIIDNGGIDTEFSYPYSGTDNYTCLFDPSTVGANMTKYVRIPRGNVTSLTQAISSVGPISVSMDAALKSFQLYHDGVYSDSKCSSSSLQLDHAVLVVGYGVDEIAGKPYFLVKNSWGMDWGIGGYFKIVRDHTNMCGLATDALYPVIY